MISPFPLDGVSRMSEKPTTADTPDSSLPIVYLRDAGKELALCIIHKDNAFQAVELRRANVIPLLKALICHLDSK